MDNELSEPIYENYDEDLQAFNGTGVILTSEEIKNCLIVKENGKLQMELQI